MPIAVPRVGVEDKPLVQDVRVEDLSALVIRSATVRDVHGMLPGCKLPDVPVIVLSIDPCISCTER